MLRAGYLYCPCHPQIVFRQLRKTRPPDGTAHRKCGAPMGVVPLKLKWLEIVGNLSRKGIELDTIYDINMNYEFVGVPCVFFVTAFLIFGCFVAI